MQQEANTHVMLEAKKELFRNYIGFALILGPMYSLFFAYFLAWKCVIGAVIYSVVTFVCLYLDRNKYSNIAAALFTFVFWFSPMWCSYFSGGIYSPAVLWLIPSLIASSFLFKTHWSVFNGAASILFLIAAAIFNAELAALNEFAKETPRFVYTIVVSTSGIGFILIYTNITNRKINSLLNPEQNIDKPESPAA